tara:strand:- start:19 stop:249 length:231 start_codon:yes stop_codon:yes gene_type:complete
MPITNSKQDWSIGKLGFRATMGKIKQQEREIADLQKENEALKATIAREKLASIELENTYIKELNSVQADYSYQKGS